MAAIKPSVLPEPLQHRVLMRCPISVKSDSEGEATKSFSCKICDKK